MSINIPDPLKLSPDNYSHQLNELQIYKASCPSSDTVYNASTAGLLLFQMPLGDRGCEIVGIGYRVVTAFDGMPSWSIGVSSNADQFCTLTAADLGLAGRSNILWMSHEFSASDFTSATDAFQILADIDDGGASAGEVELSVYFKPSLAQAYVTRSA
jgi:hypothetical protein